MYGAKSSLNPNSHTLIVRVLCDPHCTDCIRIERHAIRLYILCADIHHSGDDLFNTVVDSPKEVNVLCGTGQRSVPGDEHERSLEDKFFCMRTLRKAVNKPLDGKVLQYFVERASGFLSLVEEALVHRSRNVLLGSIIGWPQDKAA